MDENLFAQAVSYEAYIRENFKRYKAIEVSPLTNDGSMACLFDMMASRRVRGNSLLIHICKANTGLVDYLVQEWILRR